MRTPVNTSPTNRSAASITSWSRTTSRLNNSRCPVLAISSTPSGKGKRHPKQHRCLSVAVAPSSRPACRNRRGSSSSAYSHGWTVASIENAFDSRACRPSMRTAAPFLFRVGGAVGNNFQSAFRKLVPVDPAQLSSEMFFRTQFCSPRNLDQPQIPSSKQTPPSRLIERRRGDHSKTTWPSVAAAASTVRFTPIRRQTPIPDRIPAPAHTPPPGLP